MLKLGAAGCRVFKRGEGLIAEIAAVPVVARDPTGAGDAFCGGFLAGMDITGDVVTGRALRRCFGLLRGRGAGLAGLVGGSREEAADRLRR